MPNAFADLAPAPEAAPAPSNAFADLPPQAPEAPKANAFADLPPDDSHFDPRSPNYDGPVLRSVEAPGLLSRAYTAVREKLSPIIGQTDEQKEDQKLGRMRLEKQLGVELPEADASNGEGLIPAAFSGKTPWASPADAKAGDTRTKVVSNILVPGLGGAFADRFPSLASAGVNSGARLWNTLTSPGSILTLGVGGELGAAAKAGGELAGGLSKVKAGVEGLFTADQARQLVGQAPETITAAKNLVTGQGDQQKNIETLLDAGLNGFLTTVGGKTILHDLTAESEAPAAKATPAAPAPDSLGTAPVDYVGNTNYIDPATKSPARSELFKAAQDIPELNLKKGGTVSRDRLVAAGFSVPETPALDDGAKAVISTKTLGNGSPFPSLAEGLESARRGDVTADSENARETALRQSPLGGLALAADLREGRTAVPEDIRARDFAAARDEETRANLAASLKDALTSNQIGQGENIQLAPDTTEGPPQNNILANLKLREDLPEEEQFRRYLQSRAGTPPTPGPLADVQLKPLPNDAQFTVQSYTDRAGQIKRSVQLDIPNPDATGIADRTLPINSPEAALKAGYQVPDISKIPEGQTTAGALRDLKLLPDLETKTNATEKGPSAQSDLGEHPQTNRRGTAAEAGGSDSTQQSGEVQAQRAKVAEEFEPGPGVSAAVDAEGPNADARAKARERIQNLTDRKEEVDTDIGALEQKNGYTPPERWAAEDKAEHDRLTGVSDAIQKAIDGVSEKDYIPKESHTGDAATDEGLKEAAEEKPVKELDRPDYKKPGIIAEFGAPMNTELRRISPEIFGRQMRYETAIRDVPQPYLRRLATFFKSTDGLLTTHEKNALGNPLFNGKFDEVEKAIKSHSSNPAGVKQAIDALNDSRAVFKELREKAIAAGIDVNELHNFWPREVIREKFADFIDHIGGRERGPVMDAIHEKEVSEGRPLSEEEKVAVGNSVIRGDVRPGTTAKPGIFKERKIANLTSDLEPFYEDYKKSAVDYVNRVVSAIEKRNLLGKNPAEIDSSLGAIMERLRSDGKITGPMEETLKKYYEARFGVGENAGNASLRRIKDFNFTAILANPISAVTQFINFAQSAMLNGLPNSLAAVFAKREITMADFGAHNIAQELSSRSGIAGFMNKMFDISGFQKVDTLGKNNIINGALIQMRKAVADTSSPAYRKFQAKWEPIYGSDYKSFVNDLKTGAVTPNVKMAVFSRVNDVHPVTLSEMPLKYLQNPNGRIFYQLRTFQIKQLDLFRRDIFQEYKKGNVKQATTNLVRYGMYLTLAGAGVDLVKDAILGREVHPADYVLANMLKLGGVSRYQLYSAYRDGLGRAAADFIMPSIGAGLAPLDDLIHADKVVNDPLQAKSLRDLPLVGPFIYNWFGPGNEEGKTKILGAKALPSIGGGGKPHGLSGIGGSKRH